MSNFHFLRPYWFLALLPLAVLLWQVWHRKFHSRSWRAVCDPRLLPYLLMDTQGRQSRWPMLILSLVSLLIVLALAGPVWEKLAQPVFREQSALVIVFDLSRSMDAEDVKPSRLARARLKTIDILHRRKEGQTALLAYAADAYTVSPLTDDSNTIVSMVNSLNTELMPAQGSDTGKALQHATELLKQAGVLHGHILLITDGVIPSQVETLASQVTQDGHQLSVLGVGTADGAPIPTDGGGFLKDASGDIVVPKLDASALARLARLGGGRYRTLTADDSDLDALLAGINVQRFNEQRKQTTFVADRWREQGPWLLLIALPFAALAFRKGYLALLLLVCLPMLPQPARALEWNDLWLRPDQQAAQALRQNKAPASPPSADLFHDPQWKAAADYRAGRYQQATEALQGIDTADALYNKGNALAKQGKFEEAIQAYDQALKKSPQHADAKYNREQVERQLKQQQSSDKSNQDKNKDKETNKDKSSDNKQGGDNKDQPQNASDRHDNRDGQSQSQANADDKQSQQDKQDKKPEQQEAQGSEQQKSDQDKTEQDQQAGQETARDAQDSKQQAADLKEQNKQKEMRQASEQWLRRIPDDPGGLLRRKFFYEYQRQQQRNPTGNDNEQPAW